MAFAYPTLSIPYNRLADQTPECRSAYDAMTAAKKIADDATKEFQKACAHTPAMQLVKSLMGHNGRPTWDNLRTQLKFKTHGMSGHTSPVGFDVVYEDTERAPHIDPKTLNLLLNGRLLSDDEKRALLSKIGIEVSADRLEAEAS